MLCVCVCVITLLSRSPRRYTRILGSVTMWRLVFALTLLGMALALPAAQQSNPGDLGSLIDEVFPETKTTPQSVPQIGGDLDSIIKDVFGNVNTTTTTTTSNGLILGTQNQPTPKPDNCECVPYYQCKEGKILETGVGIIDIRSGFNDGHDDRQS